MHFGSFLSTNTLCLFVKAKNCICLDDCEEMTCYNKGTCLDDLFSFICECNAGFTGARCETNIDECQGSICHNNGSCIDDINNYICNCACGFQGRTCLVPGDPSYWSLDSLLGLIVMEGDLRGMYNALTVGRVGI